MNKTTFHHRPLKPGEITFDVASVEMPKDLLPDTTYKAALEMRIEKKVYSLPGSVAGSNLVRARMNGFVQAVQYAYAEHRPLRISPDMIWLLICQGISIHVNQHFDSLKDLLLTAGHPETIVIRNDSLVNKKPEHWQQLISDFSAEVKKYIKGDVYDVMVPAFTTTGRIEKTAYEVTVLETVQKGFAYLAESGCGIPKITLTGSPDDWEKIASQVKIVRQFGMENWADNLQPIVDEFVNASKGTINRDFWNGFYKEAEVYAYTYISGWILKFFPYVKKYDYIGENENMQKVFSYIPNKYMDGESTRFSKIESDDLPGGFSRIKVLWIIHDPKGVKPDEKKKMEIYSGFLGIRQDKTTKTLTPEISWAVCESNAKKVEPVYQFRERENLKHSENALWYPDVIVNVKVLPRYAPSLFKTNAESVKFLTGYLTDSIKKIAASEQLNIPALKIDFVVTWGGTIARVKLKWTGEFRNEKLENKITYLLEHLPYSWQPALTTEMEFDGITQPGMVQANYPVSISIGE